MLQSREIDIYLMRSVGIVHVPFVQYESGWNLIFNMKDITIPASSTAQIYVKKPSGLAVYNNASISSNKVTCAIDEQMLAEYGRAECQVQIRKNDEMISTFSVIFDVMQSVASGAEESQNESDILQEFVGRAEDAADAAEAAKAAIDEDNGDAEAWAVGKRGGVDVDSDDPAYHNNAKYYADAASSDATSASTNASSANTNALKAEGYAVGKQNGTAVASGSPYYENNAAYYADVAATAAATLTIDDTLTQTGQAADAKKVGDEIADLKGDFSQLNEEKAPASLFLDDVEYSGNPIIFDAPVGTQSVITTESNSIVQATSRNLLDHTFIETPTAGIYSFGKIEITAPSGAYSGRIYGSIGNPINQKLPAGTYFFHLTCTNSVGMKTYMEGYGKLEYDIDGTTYTCDANHSFTAAGELTIKRIYLSTSVTFNAGATYLIEEQIEFGDAFTSYEVPKTVPILTDMTSDHITVDNADGYNFVFGDKTIDSLITKGFVKNLINDEETSDTNTLSSNKIYNLLGVNVVNNPYYVEADTLSGDDVVKLVAPQVKRNYTVSFFANVTTVGTLYLANGKDNNFLGGYISVDDTDIKVYTSEADSTVLRGTYSHGLTLAGYISVCIHSKTLSTCDIVLTSSGDANAQGGQYKVTDAPWFGNYGFKYVSTISETLEGMITASTSGGVYTNCKLSFYASEYDCDIWAFGDSYFDLWPKFAIGNGYGNMALDGASGRNSINAYRSLLIALTKSKPKKIAWFMGMNDIDNQNSVNASWNTVFQTVKTYCELNHIELIVSTIPCNDRNNYYKNQIIKASNLRIVDIARAVGGEEIGSAWYDGLLGSDGVHPTPLGSKVIAGRVMSDIPEIMDN